MHERLRNFLNWGCFVLRARGKQMLAALLVLWLTWKYIFPVPDGSPNTDWWDWVEPLTGVITLVVAALVWLGEVNQDWKNSLPKTLTVQFVFKENNSYRIVLRCKDAYLAGEDDIRAWGQQLGRQMVDNENLDFEPYIYEHEEPLRGNIRRYTVTFVLSKLPGKKREESFQLSDGTNCNLKEYCLEMTYNPGKDCAEKNAIEQGTWRRPESG